MPGEEKRGDELQKLTLNIPASLIDEAKVAAIRRRTSVSKAVTEFLREFVKESKGAQEQPDRTSDPKAEKP